MKKFWYLLMVAVLSVGFVACDSDDAERPEEPVIVDDEVAPKDVENLVAEPGFEKITLKWTNPEDENAKKIRIFYGTGESSKKHITTEGLVEEFELNTEEHLFTSEEYAIDVMVVNDKKESFGKSVKAAYYTLTGMEYPEFALVQHIDGTWAVRATKISGLVNVTSSIRWIICDSEGAELGVTGEAQMPDFEQSVADKSCTFVAYNWLLTDVEEGVLEIGKKYIVKMDLEVYPATGGRKVDTEYVYDGSICNEFVPVAWEQEVEAKQATHYDLRESISIDEGLETIVSGKAGKRVINGMYQGMKLKWTNPSGTASNRILYGESEETAEAIDLEMVGSYVFEPGTLSEYAPVYYVQIQALDEDGAVIGIGEHDVHIFTLENIEQQFLPRFSIALQTEGEHVGKWGVTYDQLSGPRNYGIGITWNAYDAAGNAVFAEDIVDMVSEDDLKKWSSETQTAGFTTKTMYFDTDVFGFESEYTFRYTGHYFVTTNKSSKNDDGSWTYTMNTAKTLYKYDRLMWEQYDIEGESEPVVTEEQPVNLFVSAEVDNTMFQAAKVTWSQNDEAQGYEIYVNGNLKATVDASQTEALVENVTEGVKCQFEVRAIGTAATGISNEVELISMANWTEPEFKIELIDGKEEQRVVVGNLVNTNYAYAGGKIVFKRDGEEIAYTLTNNTGDGTLNSWIGYKRWALNAMDNRTDWRWNEETGEVKEHYIEPGQYTIEWEIDYVVNRNGQWATSKDGTFIPQEMKEGATHVFIPGGAEDVYFKDNVVGRIKKTGSFEMYIKGADMIVTARPSNYQSVIVDWTEMEGANSYKVLVDGVEAETTMDVTAEIFNLTDKREYTFEVVAYDALEQEIGRAKAPITEIWTLTGVREPKFDFKQNVLSVSDALDLGGTAVDMKVEFYNESGELAHTAFYSKEIDAYNLPGNIDNYDLKDGSGRGGRFTKNYWATFILKDATRNKWDWDGVENCDTPDFEPGEYTLKWTANYYTIANGYWSTGADNQDPNQFTEETGNRVQFATRDVLTTPIERIGETKLGLGFDATATPQGVYTGAIVSWSHMKAATKYEIYANGQYVGDAPAGQTSKIIEGLSAEGNPYTFKVMAVGTAFSAETEPIHIYNVEHFWKEPTFAWNGKRMVVSGLVDIDKAGGMGYAYGGAITNEIANANEVDEAKSYIEVYDETGTSLLYTLRNGTGQATLTAWAGFGRWALNAQDDRKDWVWKDDTGVIINNDGNEGDVSASYMPAGKYVLKWKIGYVVNRNANWAKSNNDSDIVSSRDQGATCQYFGPRDVKPSPHVLYTSDKKDAVLVIVKTGETILTVD